MLLVLLLMVNDVISALVIYERADDLGGLVESEIDETMYSASYRGQGD